MTDRLCMTDRLFLARFLERAATYHENAGTRPSLDMRTLRVIRDLGVLLEPPVNLRDPCELTVAQARRYAEQLRGAGVPEK